MTLKELSQLYYISREIDSDKKRLAELRQKAYGSNVPSLTGLPGGSGDSTGARYEAYIAEIVDLEAIIDAKVVQCLHERSRLERYIADIPDSLTRQIFTLRFVDGLTWLQVALRIGGGNSADSVRKVCCRYISKKR